VVWFGLLFFVITLLPVSFVTARLGFVLYLPLAGLALYAGACLVRIKEFLIAGIPGVVAASPGAASVALFVATAAVIGFINLRYWPPAPDARFSPYKMTIAGLSRLYPSMSHGARILFVKTPLDYGWDMVFLLRLYYRDNDLFLTLLNGPQEQRIPLDRLPHYDHIFDFEDGHYIELDNSDAQQSVQLHLVKAANPSDAFGETMTIGRPGAAQDVVKGVLVGDPKADGYWTLDESEFRFELSSTQHNVFRERFYLPAETLKQTGPLIVDFYVNGRLLDRARFVKDGDVTYQQAVPMGWLKTGSLTTVRMRVHNPYIAPRDGARLGVLLRSAAFVSP
jgi:hypothetical protein